MVIKLLCQIYTQLPVLIPLSNDLHVCILVQLGPRYEGQLARQVSTLTPPPPPPPIHIPPSVDIEVEFMFQVWQCFQMQLVSIKRLAQDRGNLFGSEDRHHQWDGDVNITVHLNLYTREW